MSTSLTRARRAFTIGRLELSMGVAFVDQKWPYVWSSPREAILIAVNFRRRYIALCWLRKD